MQVYIQVLLCIAVPAFTVDGSALLGGLLGINLGGLTKPVEDTLSKTTHLLFEKFGDFKNEHKKTYATPEEERKRLEIFSSNHDSILHLSNVLKLPYTLKINALADMALEEFNTVLNGLRIRRHRSNASKFKPKLEHKVNDTNVDWRNKGAVTLVRSQGLCGSCYAFAAAGALEAQYFLKTGVLQYLSPQNIMDCTQGAPYDNNGCVSGSVDPAYDFIKSNGIDTERAYPYEEKLGQACRFVKDQSAGNVTGYVLLAEGDEKGLEEAVHRIGPVAVGIDARAKSFQFYSDGVYYEHSCRSSVDDLNHAVLVIGFGTEPNGQRYWLIKNSYGPTWGQNGYGKISRNVTNPCGIATYAVYPLL